MAKYRASEPERGSVPRLFISSTVEDLRAYREGVRDAAVAAEMLPKMLEYFPAAGDRLPLDTCLDEVSAADLLAVIVAHRYGWVPPDQPGDEYKSITWLECERAVAEGREVLAFLVDDRQPWPDDQREEQAILAAVRQGTATPELLSTVQRNVARLRDFKAWLSSRRIRTTFTTPDDLRARVAEALHDWRRRRLPGRSAEPASRAAVADPGPYLRELRDDTAQIDIRGLQVGAGKANRFAIEDLYISLSAAGGWETGRRTPGGRGGPSETQADEPDDGPARAAEPSRDVPLHRALAQSPLGPQVSLGQPAGRCVAIKLRRQCRTRHTCGYLPSGQHARRHLRHSKQRRGVVLGCVRRGLLPAEPEEESDGLRQGRLSCAAWRRLGRLGQGLSRGCSLPGPPPRAPRQRCWFSFVFVPSELSSTGLVALLPYLFTALPLFLFTAASRAAARENFGRNASWPRAEPAMVIVKRG